MENKNKGILGENLAIQYLEKGGYEVLEKNYIISKSEIDVIALRENSLLVFIEVKYRKDNRFGEPESFVSADQEHRIVSAAQHYIEAINWQKDIRFDIISINEANGEIHHISDAFY